MRLFQPGPLPEPIVFRGTMIGVPICEDIWQPDVCKHLADFGAELFICVNGSPYEIDKDALRIDGVAKRRAAATGLPLAYLNRVGGQDELVFDGASFVVNGDGSLAVQMKRLGRAGSHHPAGPRPRKGWRCDRGEIAPLADHPEDIYCAMVLALRDYVNRNRFPGVVLGLSGGIDSAICAAIAADALGPERVRCVMLPSRFTSQESLDDAAECAGMIGCRLDTIPIQPAVAGFDAMLAGSFADTAGRYHRGEPPVAHSRRDADGAQQQVRADADDHRQQERDERRLCDDLWRHGRRLQSAEGRLQDDGLRHLELAQYPHGPRSGWARTAR